MYKILLATDGSEHSQKTLEEAFKLVRLLQAEAEVTVLSVAEILPVSEIFYHRPINSDQDSIDRFRKSMEDAEKNLEDRAQKILENTERDLREKGIVAKTLLKKGHPADIICKVAEEGSFDLVVLGSRGLGRVKELILGSVSNKVANCVKTSLLIVK